MHTGPGVRSQCRVVRLVDRFDRAVGLVDTGPVPLRARPAVEASAGGAGR
ncbi:hypothetical protein ACI78V_18245 [Geodermatophilus sp. SYSU D00742]